jgi:hypothetical protein
MKFRLWICSFGAVLVVLFWLLWPRPVQPVMEQKPEVPTTVNPAPVAQVPQSAQPANPGPAPILQQGNPEKLKQAKERSAKHIEALNRDIDFYGQTVDQDGNPLPGVKIGMIVPHFVANSIDGRMIHVDRTSDADGLFDIHDASVTGDGIDIEYMSKEGYTLEPSCRSVGPTSGAPGNPTIFRLWRNDIKEPLITGQKSFPIEPNGTSYVINFSKGAISLSGTEDGDLKLRINLPQPIASKSPNWSCEFQPVNGGLAEETDTSAAMYLAPTSGYSNLFNFAISPTNPWTRQSGTLRFYLRLKDGKEYGRLSIDMAMWTTRPNILRVQYAINPTGSRILR